MSFVHKFLSIISLVIFLGIGALSDPCVTYKSLNDRRRSTAYILSDHSETPLCDRYLATDWYRFTNSAGGMMPTVKVSMKSCGTLYPIWLNGIHPTVAEGEVQRTVCINQHDRNNGCARTHTIKVKNCNGQFYVYELQRLRFCSAAYCAGDKLVCPFGTVPPHCKVAFPTTIPTPEITFREKQFEPAETSGLRMLCRWEFPSWTNTTFYVEWFVNQVSKKNVTITQPTVRESFMDSGYDPSKPSEYEFKAGDTLMCRLKACYSPCNLTSPYVESSPYFVGIEITPNHKIIELEECKTTSTREFTIQLRPTVPIRCGFDWSCDDPAQPGVRLFMYNGPFNPNDVTFEDCWLHLAESEDVGKVYNLSLKAVCDNIDDGDKQLRIEYLPFWPNHPFWGDYTLSSFLVSVKDRVSRTCHANSDPHFNSFDGRYFDFMGVGDFVLYANRKRNFEVHTRQWLCGGTSRQISCSCGVAVREYNDVIRLSFCDDKGPFTWRQPRPTMLSVKVLSKGPLAPGTKIYRKNLGQSSTFTILLPSGAKVEIERSPQWFNIHVTAPVGDTGDTEGLCGDFDGDSNNDFEKGGDGNPRNTPNEYGESWRLPFGQSYFDKLPSENHELPEAEKCVCQMNQNRQPEVQCGFDKDVSHPHFPTFNQGVDVTNELNPKDKRRKKRSTNELPDFDEEDNEIEYTPSVWSFVPLVEPLPVSRENATRFCENVVLNNAAARACEKMPGMNMNVSLQNCISDLVYTGDYQMASSAIDLMMTQCEEIALKNMSLYENSTDGKMEPPMYIAENLCPNDCSGHGVCVNATCICEEDFTAGDCSMSVNQIPFLYGVTGRGLCDVRKRSCKLARVIGTGFLDSSNLTCHISEFSVISSSWTPSSQSSPHLASMTDLMEVQCELPESPVKVGNYDEEGVTAAGLKIAVSNNKYNASAEVKLIIHDSVCQECNITYSSCTLKTNSCIINGHCFGAGDINTADLCKECVPTKSQTQWNDRQVNLPPNVTSPSVLYVMQDESMSIQLHAHDPENMLLTYSLFGTNPVGSQLSPTGLFKWKVNGNATIGVKVEDECKAVKFFNFTVIVLPCHCLHNGTCIQDTSYPPGSGHYLCQCKPEYNGSHCQTDVDECVSSPCVFGTCANKIPGFRCICDPEYTGSLCDKKIVPCSEDPCYPDVLCTDSPQGGICGACPEWMTGDGKNCKDLKSPIVYEGEIRMTEEEWFADLTDSSSQRFKNLSEVYQTKINSVYKSVADFRRAKVTRFRSGSVITEFSLLFSKEQEQPLKPMIDEVEDGSLGDIKVEKTSLKLKTKPEKPKENVEQMNHFLIIGAVCGGIVFLGACILVVLVCARGKIKRKNVIISRPLDEQQTAEGLSNDGYDIVELKNSGPPLPQYS